MNYSARSLYKEVGYCKWDKFHLVVKKAIQLINNGLQKGNIKESHVEIKIGSGAVRKIIDYTIDEDGLILIYNLCSKHKIVNVKEIRNETQILRLVEKYCLFIGLSFKFQYRLDKYLYDACVNDKVLIEFDEDHHTTIAQNKIDAIKDNTAKQNGYQILRFDTHCDIIDIIIKLSGNMVNYQT